MSQIVLTGHDFSAALARQGFVFPSECISATLPDVGLIDEPLTITFRCWVTQEQMAQIGRAFQEMGEAKP